MHSRRSRKHGPGFDLMVLACHAHGERFTLYPQGWVPYGRVAVVPVASTSRERLSRTLQGTLFWSAVAAAAGAVWPEEAVGSRGEQGRGRTQSRWIDRSGRWLGLMGGDGDWCASALGVPLASHRQARERYGCSRQRVERGAAVVEMVDAIWAGEPVWLLLLRVGERTGVCGRAWRVGKDGVLRRAGVEGVPAVRNGLLPSPKRQRPRLQRNRLV